jgi:hypothetical protein
MASVKLLHQNIVVMNLRAAPTSAFSQYAPAGLHRLFRLFIVLAQLLPFLRVKKQRSDDTRFTILARSQRHKQVHTTYMHQ